mgnify:FL=1
MQFTPKDLIYFIGMRELEKEQLKTQLQQSMENSKNYKNEVEKLKKEKENLMEKKLIG